MLSSKGVSLRGLSGARAFSAAPSISGNISKMMGYVNGPTPQPPLTEPHGDMPAAVDLPASLPLEPLGHPASPPALRSILRITSHKQPSPLSVPAYTAFAALHVLADEACLLSSGHRSPLATQPPHDARVA